MDDGWLSAEDGLAAWREARGITDLNIYPAAYDWTARWPPGSWLPADKDPDE